MTPISHLSLPFQSQRVKKRLSSCRHARRGHAAVLTALCGSVVLGFAAMAIDLGVLYDCRAELQRTADSAALAAASRLAAYGAGDPMQLARQAAIDYAAGNKVLGGNLKLDESVDVTFGRGVLDPVTGKFSFVATDEAPDAVRVRVRRTADSPNGAVPLFFARIFGKTQAESWAQATAFLRPRDIAVAADLSGSHTDDSEIKNYKVTAINLHDVWSALPGGLSQGDPGYSAQTSGPNWGTNMTLFGQDINKQPYNPSVDNGLLYMPKGSNWTNPQIRGLLQSAGYNTAEVNALMSAANDSTTDVWRNRVAVALGIAEWNSGIPGGRWQTQGIAVGGSGWGNTRVDNAETIEVVPYPYNGSTWRSYFDYVASSSSGMTSANSAFRYMFGPKTFVNYLLESHPSHADTPQFADAPVQPMQAVKDSVTYMMDRIVTTQSNDQASLEIYGTTARHEIDLTTDVTRVSDRLNAMQAGHYDSYTFMAGGMDLAIESLTGPLARAGAAKTMILLTDGVPNVLEDGRAGNRYQSQAEAEVVMKAYEAVQKGIRIYCVSVGSGANLALMDQIAAIGKGEHFHAEGSVEEYSAQLDKILGDLGNKRPIMLIQ